tara:strand:- start:997 stop:2121 length:1125 start_codon:yes stop_codon:yes gene_type:complete
MYTTFATRITSLVGEALTTNAIDQDAFTEWLSEEAINAINIMSPEMLISASSTHRLTDAEQFNDVGRNVYATVSDTSAVSFVLTAGSIAYMKVGSILAFKASGVLIAERVRVTSISGSTIGIERGVNDTSASAITGGWDVFVVHQKTFNTRKFKLLEVNRDGYSARLLRSGLSKQAHDKNSIHYATSKSPVYYVKSGNIYILPLVLGYEQGEVVGVTYPTVKHDMKSTTDLPSEAEDFIVIGASRKYLIRSMYEEFAQLPAGITKPTVAGATEELTATLTHDASADSNKLDFSDWFEVAGDMIQTDEDIELASAQLQKIGTYIQTHQEELATKNTVFASALQRATTKYNWFMAQYDKLTLMYNEKAQILRGPQA